MRKSIFIQLSLERYNITACLLTSVLSRNTFPSISMNPINETRSTIDHLIFLTWVEMEENIVYSNK